VQPPSTFLLTGWQPGMAPPPEYMNWAFYELDQWVQYLDQIVEGGIPDNAIRLLGGGDFSFDATTGVLSWNATAFLAMPGVPDGNNTIAAGSVTLNDGDIAYLTPNTPVSSTASILNGSNTLTGVAFTGNILPGMAVSGPGIPGATTVLSVGADTVTLNANATANETNQTYVFSSAGALTVHTGANASVPVANGVILLARRYLDAVYLGVNCAQIVLRDGESKTLDGYGYFSVYQAPAGQNLTAGQLVYLSPGSSDGGRTAGAAYPLDCGAVNQAVRGTYAGVVISNYSTSETATIVYSGFRAATGLVAGAIYYADPATPGGITPSAPTLAGQKIVPVGFATTSTQILFTGAAGAGSPQSFPIFYEEPLQIAVDGQTNFPITNVPLSADAVFVFVDGAIVPKTEWDFLTDHISFHSALAGAQEVFIQYILAGQAYLFSNQEVPAEPANGTNINFTITGSPANKASTFVYVDGAIVDPSLWGLSYAGSGSVITFGTAPAAGQDVYVCYFSGSVGGGGGGGGLTGVASAGDGSGFSIVDGVVGSTARFFDVKAGANVTIAPDGDGNLVISASPASGGGAEAHGSKAAAVQIDTGVGMQPSAAMDQVWWVKPLLGGQQNCAILTAGATVGQRLTLIGVSATDKLKIADGAGTDQNGVITLDDNQAITYFFDGSTWAETSRRS